MILLMTQDNRMESLRAFVAGYIASHPGAEACGREAEQAFNRWYNDPNVQRARDERAAEQAP